MFSQIPSHRWKTTSSLDVDAYCLTDNGWLLFAYVKEERLAADNAYFNTLANTFPHGRVLGVARALKTESGSEPLDPVPMQSTGATLDSFPLELWCREGWIRYRLETRKVLNPGLFLDQAANRQRLIELVQHHVARHKGEFGPDDGMLNLFSYTGSFSVAAACGGARATTSVDVSSRYLEWEKQNFGANFGGTDVVNHRVICDDARDFLRRSVKRGNKFRWIVIDPPTFSRGQGKPFKIQDEMMAMLEDAEKCLTRGGAILAAGNDARWESKRFFAEMGSFAKSKGLIVEKGEAGPGFGLDHPLKSAWLVSAG